MKLVHFIELLLLFGVLVLIGVPLFRGLAGVSLFSDRNKLLEEYKHLLVRKEEVLISIKESEFDFEANKVSQADYDTLRQQLESEATSILERLDELEQEKKKNPRKTSNHAGGLVPPVGFIPRGLPRLLNENPCRIPRPLAAGSFNSRKMRWPSMIPCRQQSEGDFRNPS